jgi:hypothetical protein
MKLTITNLRGENEYLSMSKPEYESSKCGQADYGTGVWLIGIFRGPKTGRMFISTDSIWDNGNGCCVGQRTREVDESEYLRACRVAGIDPSCMAHDV